jgi:hypothetical protein
MEKQTLADLGWTSECDTFDVFVDARLKIQDLEAELTRLEEEHEKELRRAFLEGVMAGKNGVSYMNRILTGKDLAHYCHDKMVAYLFSRKQENNKTETPAGTRPGSLA